MVTVTQLMVEWYIGPVIHQKAWINMAVKGLGCMLQHYIASLPNGLPQTQRLAKASSSGAA